MNKRILDIMLCENSAKEIKRLKNGTMVYHYENKENMKSDINFINKAFNSVVYSILDNKLMIVNC